MYEIIKYVKDHGMNISISYKDNEDVVRLEVSLTCGVRLYKVNKIIYGVESINISADDLIFTNVKLMVEKLGNLVIIAS